jgi:hypothetical protein
MPGPVQFKVALLVPMTYNCVVGLEQLRLLVKLIVGVTKPPPSSTVKELMDF